MDSYDDETGDQVARALRSPAATLVRSALIGCHFYSDDPDRPEAITDALDDPPILITRRAGGMGRVPYGVLKQGYIIPNGPDLRTALKAARTPWDEQMERAASILLRERIDPATLTADHRLALAEAFEKTHAGFLPSAVSRRQNYQLLRDYGLYRQAARLLEAWRGMVPTDSPDETTILIELAACHRHMGQIALAHETSDLLVMRSKTLPSGTKAVFASERAAILLDLFERDHDPARLIEARRWAGIAWSIDQSDYVSKIYRRLTSLETDR